MFRFLFGPNDYQGSQPWMGIPEFWVKYIRKAERHFLLNSKEPDSTTLNCSTQIFNLRQLKHARFCLLLPFLVKNSLEYFPATISLRGIFPRSSMINAMWSVCPKRKREKQWTSGPRSLCELGFDMQLLETLEWIQTLSS